jgi:hypothetical protein
MKLAEFTLDSGDMIAVWPDQVTLHDDEDGPIRLLINGEGDEECDHCWELDSGYTFLEVKAELETAMNSD